MKNSFTAISLFLVIFCFSSISASAATITVNTLVDENNTGANCSLREAITAEKRRRTLFSQIQTRSTREQAAD